MKVILIGAGNAGTILGRRIRQAGHTIMQVFSRDQAHAAALAGEFHCPYTTYWTMIDPGADLYLVALSDTALKELPEHWKMPGRLVVHTAGAVPMDILTPVSERCGVLYPLQSLRKEIPEAPEIPLLIDARVPADRSLLESFARTISPQVERADDTQRLKLHVAAVFVNNFTNHLYTLAEDYCRREQLDFSLLLPIITETTSRLRYFSPRDVQTGPAIRNDQHTIDRHLGLLADYPGLKTFYELFTDQIRQYRKP